jgi:YD repeat-containing protein
MRVAPGGGRSRSTLIAWLLAFMLATASWIGAIHAQSVQYVYDELGRLIAAVNPAGETTLYSYDEVGNLVSVSRASSSQVSVLSFAPGRGQVGETVTLFGSGFSANPAQNSVRFNGTPATVASSTATSIVTTVPVAAATGAISVTTPQGSATSAAAFIVFAGQSPQIASFAPAIAPPGGTVTISGSGFEPVPSDNQAIVNTSRSAVITAAGTTLTNRVPLASGGKIAVTTAYGSAMSAEDLFIVPSPNAAADVAATTRIAIEGAGAALNLPESKIGLVLFDGNAGTTDAKLSVSGVTLPAGGTVTVYRPDGAALLGPLGFGAAGTSVSLANRTRWLRSHVAGCFDPSLASGPAARGPGPDPLALVAVHCGPASAGGCVRDDQVGGFVEDHPTGNDRNFFCVRKDGSVLAKVHYSAQACPTGTAWNGENPGMCVCAAGETVNGTCALPTTGSYGVRVTSLGGAGSATVRAARDITGTLAADNSAVLTFSEPGQVARFAFPGAAGEELGIDVSNVTLPSGGTVVVNTPNGNMWLPASFPTGSGAGIPMPRLPVAGIYTVVVTPAGSATGSVRMTLWRALRGTLALDQLNNVNIAYRKQGLRMTFAGLPDQIRGVDVSDVSLSSGTLTVFAPSGGPFINPLAFTSPAGVGTRLSRLVQNGNYTVEIMPSGEATGSFKLRLWSDVTDSIAIGAPYALVIPNRNQQARLMFTGATGDKLQLALSNVTLPAGGLVRVLTENGAEIVLRAFGPEGLVESIRDLPFPGTYTVVIEPTSSGTGALTVTLSNR